MALKNKIHTVLFDNWEPLGAELFVIAVLGTRVHRVVKEQDRPIDPACGIVPLAPVRSFADINQISCMEQEACLGKLGVGGAYGPRPERLTVVLSIIKIDKC
jgi:hypothetical protein